MLKTERYSIRIFKANNSITIANVSSIWSYFAQKEFELSGIFPEASFENMRIICNKKSVCEDHIANCIQINTIRHPSDTIVPEDFNQVINHMFNGLKKFYNNCSFSITVEEIFISFFELD